MRKVAEILQELFSCRIAAVRQFTYSVHMSQYIVNGVVHVLMRESRRTDSIHKLAFVFLVEIDLQIFSSRIEPAIGAVSDAVSKLDLNIT